MATILVHIALLCYTGAAAAYLAWLLRPRDRLVSAGRVLLSVGLAFHVVAFPLLRLSESARVWNAGHLFSLISAATVAAYLLIDWKYRVPVAGAFAAPLTVAAMVPAHLVPTRAREFQGGVESLVMLTVHVGCAIAGSVALGLAFALALVFLSSERRIKRKQAGWLLKRLPSLELVERIGWQLSVWGFIFLSVTLGTGSLVSKAASGSLFTFAPKQAFAVLAWSLLAVLIQARLVAGWRGRRLALLVVVGFVFLIGTYVALLSRAPHVVTAALGPLQ
jgi:ABC-type uncharacterized transport system permease subunit